MRSIALLALAAFASPLASEAATCSPAYGTCGGSDWHGATCCVDGYFCSAKDEFYSQCLPQGSTPFPTTAAPTVKPSPSGGGSTGGESTPTPSPAPTKPLSNTTYLTYDTVVVPAHQQAAYPATSGAGCGSWKLTDNVCCASYCSNDNQSQSCGSECSGKCVSAPAADCKSGTMWGEQTTVTTNEAWHYSRSTHFGETAGGACGFGLYALCTKGGKDKSWTDPLVKGFGCDAFCNAYPVLCQDPANRTLRGNFAAPNGDYYTQFWPHLEGDRDNYLSCGECFEVIKTKKDGTDYKPGEAGYTDPVMLEVIDSCPCNANAKWCCGSGDDHCGEVSDFKYGCPLPKDSHHLDLSDVAMGRLQGGGSLIDGVIPTRYRRVQCPKPGNMYLWLREKGSIYWFSFSVVNAAGVGSVTKVEVKGAKSNKWTTMIRDPNYTPARPQERYGSLTIPQNSGPYNLPIAVRITSPNGEQVVNEEAIKSFTIPATAPNGYYYIDFGAQFTMDGKH